MLWINIQSVDVIQKKKVVVNQVVDVDVIVVHQNLHNQWASPAGVKVENYKNCTCEKQEKTATNNQWS